MKTTLTLSAVVLSLTLAPAAFATGAQEQSPVQPARSAHGTVTIMQVEMTAPNQITLTRSALKGLDVELRATLLASLRESSLQLLQLAAPALEGAGAAILEGRAITAR